MGQSPSFYNLFSRGRYHRGTEPDEEIKRRQNRTEEFAVAALAFALKHDTTLFEKFLSEVCQIKNPDNLSTYTITCQAAQYADLLITKPKQLAIVIEAKVFAGLKNHQDPWSNLDSFKSKEKGYGYQISNDYKGCPDIRYLAVSESDADKDTRKCEINGTQINFFKRSWVDLKAIEKGHPLLSDLLDTLGDFGLTKLKMRKFKDLSLQNHTTNAAAMYCLLGDVSKDVGIDNINWGIEFHKDGGIMGINLEKGFFSKKIIEVYFKTESQIAGWFGYEHQGHIPRLTIWFYTPDKNFRRFVESKTKLSTHDNLVEKDGFFFIQKEQSTEDDVDWLSRNLRLLKEGTPDNRAIA